MSQIHQKFFDQGDALSSNAFVSPLDEDPPEYDQDGELNFDNLGDLTRNRAYYSPQLSGLAQGTSTPTQNPWEKAHSALALPQAFLDTPKSVSRGGLGTVQGTNVGRGSMIMSGLGKCWLGV